MSENKTRIFSCRISEKKDKELLFFIEKLLAEGKEAKEILYSLYRVYIMSSGGEQIGTSSNAVISNIDIGSLTEELLNDDSFGEKIKELQGQASGLTITTGGSSFENDMLAETIARKVVAQLLPHLSNPSIKENNIIHEPLKVSHGHAIKKIRAETPSKIPSWQTLITKQFDAEIIRKQR